MRQKTGLAVTITFPSNFPSAIVRVAFALSLTAFAYGCSAQADNLAGVPAPMHETTHPRVVLASWYGPGFEGRTTSSGETFRQNGYTAASPTLPLGSHVRVTNLSTGRSVVVRINDRGPFVKGRGLDLSHAAARKIGLDRRGVGAVRVARVDRASEGVHDSRASKTEMSGASRYRRGRHVEPVHYARTSPITPVEATTESSSMVSNPVGSWLMELVSPIR
jgi:rare lipoprotein A (peptidoglycan hydrolase)